MRPGGLARRAALLALLWLGRGLIARAQPLDLPPGTLSLNGQGFLIGSTGASVSHFASFDASLLQQLRESGDVRADFILYDNNGSFLFSRLFAQLEDYRYKDRLWSVLAGDVTKPLGIFVDQPTFVYSPYLLFRGGEIRMRPPGNPAEKPLYEMALFGGRASSGLPQVGAGGSGFSGNATLVGASGSTSMVPRLDLGLTATHAVFDHAALPARTNLQLEASYAVLPGLKLNGVLANALYSGATDNTAWRVGPSWASQAVRFDAYARRSGTGFSEIPGRFLDEHDSRAYGATLAVTPPGWRASVFASGQLQRSNLDDNPAVSRFDQKSGFLQFLVPVRAGALSLEGNVIHSENRPAGEGAVPFSADLHSILADWSFLLGHSASGSVGAEYRRQASQPAQGGSDFQSGGLVVRLYGIDLLGASAYGNLRLERRFPLISGVAASWQWNANLGVTKTLSRTDVRALVAFNSADVSLLAPQEKTHRWSGTFDVTRHLSSTFAVALGATYQHQSVTSPSVPGRNDWQVRLSFLDRIQWGRTPRVRPGFEGAGAAPRGAVLGRVYLDENENGALDSGDRPLEQIGVRLGHLELVVTNRRGDFIFYDVPDGTYRLQIVLRTLSADFDAVPSVYTVEVVNGGAVRRDFRVVRVGIVRGSVSQRVARNGVESNEAYEGALVKLTSGAFQTETTTDEAGRYSFESVPPGPYEIVLDPESLPERARILDPPKRAGVITRGSEDLRQDLGFEVPVLPDEIIKFPPAPPKPKAPAKEPVGRKAAARK